MSGRRAKALRREAKSYDPMNWDWWYRALKAEHKRR